ncbi:MAG TPA: thiamine-phosphate kinase [Rhizomicrobium sp.]|jgi:thiamine-monophosphate kinase|nr:thiamine-phosphate kinase [Rhizomicrobium sp.]
MTNSDSRPARPGEFELIAELFAPLATSAGAFGLTDDAAIVAPPSGFDLVVTADAVIEGVHLLAEDPPHLIAKKALRVNLSDLAAKGCKPHGYLLVLAIPPKVEMHWLAEFARGLKEDQNEFAISLLGGDTNSTAGPLTIAITAFGLVPNGTVLRRSGAKPGDLVYVSGMVGAAGGGLACLKAPQSFASLSLVDRGSLINRYRLPEPRLSLGQALHGIATSAIDVSDGLLADLGHIAEASGARIVIEGGRIPVPRPLRTIWGDDDALVRAATTGDDYEIAFTAPSSMRTEIAKASTQSGVPVTEIGHVEAGAGLVLLGEQGREISVPEKGFSHF